MSLSLPQIIIIALIIIVVFGSGKFPNIMENIAKGIKSFNKGLTGETDIKEAELIEKNKKEPTINKRKTTTKKTTKSKK